MGEPIDQQQLIYPHSSPDTSNSANANAIWEKVYEKHQGLLVGIASRLLGNQDNAYDAYDAMHDAFLIAYGIVDIEKEASSPTLRAYLCTLVHNISINMLKKGGKVRLNTISLEAVRESGLLEPYEEDSLFDQVVIREEAREIVTVAKQIGLSPKERLCIDLKVAGFAFDEIALVTGDNKNTVTTRYYRAISKIREEVVKRRGG
jgi:RNA polymerase sigma factor (sigma-70 family)